MSIHHCHTNCSIIRDSTPLRHGNGALFRAARAFCMLISRERLALSDWCPAPGPPIFTSQSAGLTLLALSGAEGSRVEGPTVFNLSSRLLFAFVAQGFVL